MRMQSIAFKWSIGLPLDIVTVALGQVGIHPEKKRNHWSRSYSNHLLQIEYRPGVSTKEHSSFWLRWVCPNGTLDKGGLDRPLADWFFTMSQYGETTVNWMQVIVYLDECRLLYGYSEHTQKIWVKEDKPHRFSFFPVQDCYHFEVRNMDIRKSIQHHRFSVWLDDLKHNLLGHERPNDQISFDMVG